jgi:putative ABC transport system ATP-binding protein
MLELTDATVTFASAGGPSVRAVDGVTMEIGPGSFVVVIGTNGSGKSTLLGAIAGTVPLDGGTIRLAGVDLTRWPEHRRAALVGRVYQDPRAGTAGGLTVLENIAVADRRGHTAGLRWATSRKLREYAARMLAAIVPGLEQRLDQPIGSLSGGQRQIVTLLMATWQRPELLLLDEHTPHSIRPLPTPPFWPRPGSSASSA